MELTERWWCVYVPPKSRVNFEVARREGIWGVKSKEMIDGLRPGHRILFVFAATGAKERGGLRVSTPEDFSAQGELIVQATVSEPPFESTAPLWPDRNDEYPWRFRFRTDEVASAAPFNVQTWPRELVDGVRLSLIKNGAPEARGPDAITDHAPVDSLEEVVATWIDDECRVRFDGSASGPAFVVDAASPGEARRYGLGRLVGALAEDGIAIDGFWRQEGASAPQRVDLDPSLGWMRAGLEPGAALERALGPGREGARVRIRLRGDVSEQAEAVLRSIARLETAKELVAHVHASLEGLGLTFSKDDVADFYLSLRTKPLVLLAGLSGTGKSLLARRFAEACGFACTSIPVRPDWSDPSDLLGAENLKGEFKPGPMFHALVDAHAAPGRPHFVLLDEMNLARVEHYFSDVLSVLETRRRAPGARAIETDALMSWPTTVPWQDRWVARSSADRAAELPRLLAERGLSIPGNLAFIGTVNIDESTHPFSKKVLDRAMTHEFSTVELREPPRVGGQRPKARFAPTRLMSAGLLGLAEVWEESSELLRDPIDLLARINVDLATVSAQVGYRVRDEISLYLHLNKHEGGLLGATDALDRAIHHKVLPRLQGGEELRGVLEKLQEVCRRAKLAQCEQKLEDMIARLESTHYTAFWI